MADTTRIEELRRRVQRDPASIAFAQLAEEYRRAGRFTEAIETCESGLAHHPGYLSARVTLGRSLLETGALDAAQLELKQVLRAAPENLAALRGLAEIHHRRGELHEALAHYRTALEFARQDPELEHLVEQISRELEPQPAPPVVVDGMSFEEMKDAFLNLSLDAAPAATEPTGGEGVAVAPPAEAPPVVLPESETPSEPVVSDAAVLAPSPAAAPEPVVPPESGEQTEPVGVVETGIEAEHPAPVETAPGRAGTATADRADSPLVLAGNADNPSPVDVPAARAELHLPSATELLSPGLAVGEPAAVALPPASPQVDALERWLDAILAERERRHGNGN